MPFKEPLYKADVATLKDYGGIKRKITLHRFLRTSGLEVDDDRIHTPKATKNDEKLECNLSRTKAKVFEYAYCNLWDYFITLTISSQKFDRTDLKGYYKKFNQWLRNYNKKYGLNIKYLFIPELHEDGMSWHMHGFIMGLPESHLSYNSNGYLDWLAYSAKFGYVSIDKIRDRQRIASYITKYISKNLSDCITELNAKVYYNSQGLKTAVEIKRGTMSVNIAPDFENEYVKVKWYDDSLSLDTLKKLIF